MSTFLFNEIIFGPVKSRRLGVSLGINLLPTERKICNFNCIYCECGWTGVSEIKGNRLPSRTEVYSALDVKLAEMKSGNLIPDVITYAGNGEPTLHPEFPGIIDDSISLRNKYFPKAKIAVLSNSTTIGDPSVRNALLKVDQNILKLDSAVGSTVMLHNKPKAAINIEELIENLASFNGRLIIQTLFLRGTIDNNEIDNTSPAELDAWVSAIKRINPSAVMIYTISRDTPQGADLEKIPLKELNRIAARIEKLGITTQVSG